MSATGYPLSWPSGWPRARNRQEAKFNRKVDDNRGYAVTKAVNLDTAVDRLQQQLDLLKAGGVILSCNLERNLRGGIRGDRGEPGDPGVAVYFTLAGKDMVLACDRWSRVADNIVAIAKHIEALRGMDRWGVGSIDQAFAGYAALPAPEPWWIVLGFDSRAASREMVEQAYRLKAKTAHPDQGGNRAGWDRLQAAYAAAKADTP